MQKKYSFKLGYYLFFLLLVIALPVTMWAVLDFEYDKKVALDSAKNKFIQLVQSGSRELESEGLQKQGI